MDEYLELYTPSLVRGSYFNRMIHCGFKYNYWVEVALSYMPPNILWEHKEKLAFIGTGAMDACRVAPALSKDREIIILSECIFPKKDVRCEDDSKARYFIFVVLHEIAHAINKHRSPLLDDLTPAEIESQEKEADDLAMLWFNEHVKAVNNRQLKAITPGEISLAKAESQKLRERLYEEGF